MHPSIRDCRPEGTKTALGISTQGQAAIRCCIKEPAFCWLGLSLAGMNSAIATVQLPPLETRFSRTGPSAVPVTGPKYREKLPSNFLKPGEKHWGSIKLEADQRIQVLLARASS